MLDEAALTAWFDKYAKRKFDRLLLNRCFQGVITQVNLTAVPFRVKIQRVGDSNPDPTDYACPIPGYFPVVGDRVELIWRDDFTAEVLAPLSKTILSPQLIDKQQYSTTISSISIPKAGPIPKGFSKIRIGWSARSTSGNVTDFVYMQLNGDTGAHYDYVNWTPTAPTNSLSQTQARIGITQGGTAGAGQFASGWIEILNYDQAYGTVGFCSQSVYVGAGFISQELDAGRWTIGVATAFQAVTSIQIYPSGGVWAANSVFTTEVYP
jgi:hypothetical protein